MTILDINNNSFYNKFDYNVEKAIDALKKEFGNNFQYLNPFVNNILAQLQFIHPNYLMVLFLHIVRKMFKKL